MPADGRTLAVDVGASRTRVALVEDGCLAERSDRQTRELIDNEGSVVPGLVEMGAALLQSAGRPTLVAVGIGLAASVNRQGSVLQSREFGIPAGPGLHDAFASSFGTPVAVDNDANLAALAEYRLGAARGFSDAAVLTLGTNIGLGLILDGDLYRGAHGAAGEVGLLLVRAPSTGERSERLRMVDAGTLGRTSSAAPDGYAWIEELAGGGALAAMTDGLPGGLALRRVVTVEALADPALQPIRDRAVEGWAFIIANLSVLLDLELVVLTGGLATDAAHLLGALRRRVAELVALVPEIRLGSLGPDAELLGADLLARAALDDGAAHHARAGLSAQPIGERR
jgi:predicted NBD/HSP70 family sugar kinase